MQKYTDRPPARSACHGSISNTAGALLGRRDDHERIRRHSIPGGLTHDYDVAAYRPKAAAETRITFLSCTGAVSSGQNGEWTESRRCMALKNPSRLRQAARPDMGQNITSETGLTIEAITAKCNDR